MPKKVDKLMFLGKEGIFIGYDKQTISYYRSYAPYIYKTIISSNMDFFKNTPGSAIRNY
jgi:hypothetical protein